MKPESTQGDSWCRRCLAGVARAFRVVLEAILFFLEVIGLRAPRPRVGHDAQLAGFRLHYDAFRRLLRANDSFLRSRAEFERKMVEDEPYDAPYLREASIRMVADIYRMIDSIQEISGGRHDALWRPFETISSALVQVVDAPRSEHPKGLALDLSEIDYRDAACVGAKMANLAEIRNQLGLPTPDGFALTVRAYRLFLEQNGLDQQIQIAHLNLDTPDDADRASRSLVSAVQNAQVPKEIQREILSAYQRLIARDGTPCAVAVRSSALGEDERLSFAGQYETVLNVHLDGLADAWRRVVASLYSPAANHYRLLHGLPGLQAAMPVGFVAMVPAIMSGVAYSRDPARLDEGQVIIQVVLGLGVHLVDGSKRPETLEVLLGTQEVTVSRIAAQGPGASQSRHDPWLSDAEAEQLARWSRMLEAHFGSPQDVEWAMDRHRRLFLLQSRPLELAPSARRLEPQPIADARVLVSGGEVVCPGVGSGVAVHLDVTGDFSTFPDRGVLVIKRPSPRFVALMRKAAAIVADSGSTTGHMASLAREFRVPTLMGTRDGTRQIPHGHPVTVDALRGYVYEGVVAVPGAGAAREPTRTAGGRDGRARLLFGRVAELIVPLRLTDPHAPEFRAEKCSTLHDIARFVHERSYEEMFKLSESLGDFRSAAYYLDVFLPVDLYIIDLGGGVIGPVRGNRIKLNQIVSVPLSALLKGMLHPRIPRWGARPIDLGGFMSVVMQHAMTNPEQERSFRDPCYALVSDRYVNYTARVGYHFSVVDAYCGETANKNYVQVLFRGGAADLVRRCRRARAIAGILKEWGFSVQISEDSTHGRIRKMPRDETARHIEHVGRLFQFMRQMDVAMTSEGAVQQVQEAFLREDYALELRRPARDG